MRKIYFVDIQTGERLKETVSKFNIKVMDIKSEELYAHVEYGNGENRIDCEWLELRKKKDSEIVLKLWTVFEHGIYLYILVTYLSISRRKLVRIVNHAIRKERLTLEMECLSDKMHCTYCSKFGWIIGPWVIDRPLKNRTVPDCPNPNVIGHILDLESGEIGQGYLRRRGPLTEISLTAFLWVLHCVTKRKTFSEHLPTV